MKKALMLGIKAFPCRHSGEKVEEINVVGGVSFCSPSY
jgi:hypothetical protein